MIGESYYATKERVGMKKRYLFMAVLAALALAASACAPNPAVASQAGSNAQAGATPGSDTSGYGYGAATSAPTQEPSSDSTGYGAGSALESTAAPAQSSASMSTVNVADNSQLGSILVDQNGMTLYLFLNDTQGAGTSACSGGCAAIWPALAATSPTAGTGVDASKLGTITRSDGTMQVTYNGWPLYTYAPDTKPGDTNGQGIKSVWYVVAPSGDAVK
jgi:predicted lipoprotein with Yx(FWY)xxD motif